MMLVINREELQAATHATLRAHAITDEAKALVAKLAAMVEDHGISAGSRKNRRKGTAGLSCCRFDGRLVKLIPPCARIQR
jgi:hypothetical protein